LLRQYALRYHYGQADQQDLQASTHGACSSA
jgi:hypothetical protein